jgi:hypothetical protein
MPGAIPPLPNTPSWRGAQLKHRDNLEYSDYAMGWTNGVQFPAGARFFFFVTGSSPVLGPTQHPIQCVYRGLFPWR